MRVTVLGMGSMGRAFASRALDRGHHVTVWNRTAGKAAALVARGATEMSSVPDAVAHADATLVVVADDEAVLDLCVGIDGAMASVANGAVLANVSTVSPATARELAAAGPADAVLDAPVLGGPAQVAAGAGRFLIGGPAEAVHRLDRLWADLGSGYVHCGPSGTGAVMKLLSNLQLVIGVTALAEAVATARRQGIDDQLLRTVFGDSPVLSPASRQRLDAVLRPDHPGWFSPALARKDVRLAVALAEQSGVPAQLGPAVENLLTTVLAAGRWPDFAAVLEAFR
ncbi:MAG TPA: NAD(P)-dependent oxidoreductase [Pseudonocardiaceae bacterium]|nr:NAD(P)-dependent oxidoreductase [Pseudonocardiaceae bacterium]